jgi:hypothetical protein
MQQRQELFNQNLKQKYRPKVDETKRKEVEDRFLDEQLKREKLIQNAGADPKQFGKEYLEIIRKMKRS